METKAKLFARNLRAKRRAAGLTQDALGEMISYSGKSVSKWESGEAYPPAELLPDIAKILNSDIDSFFDYKEAPRYFLGIDGGGTKCDYLLVDAGGHVLKTHQGGAANPLSVGPRAAFENMKSGITNACEGYPYGQISVYAGLAAGSDAQVKSMVVQFLGEFGFACCDCGSDAQNSIAAGLKGEDGVAVIMGTGSTAFSSLNGVSKRYGGYGHLVADHGSGFTYGRAVISSVLSHKDGSGRSTVMTEMLQKKMGKEPILLIPDIYEGGKQYVASFAPIVFEAYKLGDAVAIEAVEVNVKLLSNLIRAALRDFDGLSKEVPVVLCGGLCAHSSIIVPIMERNLKGSRYSEIRIMTEKPVYGAVINARKVFDELMKKHNESN